MTTIPKRRSSPYISISKNEYARTLQIDAEVLRNYISLRWLANFKTGEAGKDANRPLSLHSLEKLWSLSQANVKERLNALHAAGLVDQLEIGHSGSLSFRLPLSVENMGQGFTKNTVRQNSQLSDAQHSNLCPDTIKNQYYEKSTDTPSTKSTLSLISTGHESPKQPLDPNDKLFLEMCEVLGPPNPEIVEEAQMPDGKSESTEYDRHYMEFDVLDIDEPAMMGGSSIAANTKIDQLKQILVELHFQYVHGTMTQSILPRMVELYSFDDITKTAKFLTNDRRQIPTPLRLWEALARASKTNDKGKVAL